MATATNSTPKITIVWAQDLNGKRPALDFFESLNESDRSKLLRTFSLLESGNTNLTHEQFKSLSKNHLGKGLFEFKEHQHRLIGGFLNGGKFAICYGLTKKKDDLSTEVLVNARRILREHSTTMGSQAFITLRSPKPNPDFKPLLPPPPVARPLHIVQAPKPLFRPIPQEYSWAFVKSSDLLPPDAPLMQSLVRLPRIHHVLTQDHVEPYVRERLQNLSKDARMALGILSDDQLSSLILGAIWGIELVTALELDKSQLEPQPEIIVEPPAELALEPEPEPVEAPPAELPTYYWYTVPFRMAGRTNKRWIAKIVGPPLRKSKDQREPMVRIRTFQAKQKRWSNIKSKPQAQVKDKVSQNDPRYREALHHDPR